MSKTEKMTSYNTPQSTKIVVAMIMVMIILPFISAYGFDTLDFLKVKKDTIVEVTTSCCGNATNTEGTFNATYDLWSYNQTYTEGTFNVTYNLFSYNHTSINPSNTRLSNFQNITNIPSCTATQVLTNRTGGGLQCVEDQTGGGSSAVSTYSITASGNIRNATGLAFVTIFTMPLVADTNYSINCFMLHTSNATTSGIRYNMSLAGNPDWMVVGMRAMTSATATQASVVSGTTKSLMPTAVTASLATPTLLPDELKIYIDGNANTGGNAILQFSGELANLLAIVGRGSYCEVNVITN